MTPTAQVKCNPLLTQMLGLGSEPGCSDDEGQSS